VHLVVWLVLIVVWVIASAFLLRPPTVHSDDPPDEQSHGLPPRPGMTGSPGPMFRLHADG
jgi:hypothetical protein